VPSRGRLRPGEDASHRRLGQPLLRQLRHGGAPPGCLSLARTSGFTMCVLCLNPGPEVLRPF
jgi:hypothetical protein